MNDYIIRAVDAEGKFRFHIADSTAMAERSRQLHEDSPTAAAAMGRILTMAAIMGMNIESEGESITLNIRGDGPGGYLVAVCDHPGMARVSAGNPQADVPSREDGHLDVGSWVGREGRLSVVRTFRLKEPFVGITELVSGEIAEDFASYFFHSEQTPTIVALGVFVDGEGKVSAAGGVFIQALPGAEEEDLVRLEEVIQRMAPVTTMLLDGLSPEQILDRYFSVFEPKILDRLPLAYDCPCSRKKMERALASLPLSDLQDLVEDGQAELVCEFCMKKYHFSGKELEELVSTLQKDEKGDQSAN